MSTTVTRRERIDQLLGEERLTGAMERSWDYHGVRATASMTLALLEIADSLTDIASELRTSNERDGYDSALSRWQSGAGKHPDD